MAASYFLVLAFELLYEVVDETVIEILTTQVGVTSSRLDFEDTLLNSQKRDIEGSSTKIEDQNVALAFNLLVKTVCNGSRGRLVDNSENIETSNKTSVLCGLTLRVGEISWDGNNCIVDGSAKVCLRSLSHLDQDHR
jgi:hypothetical protein